MNRYIGKKTFIVINIILFFLEIVMVYLLITKYLSNDIISPNEITFYEYLINKFNKQI